MTRFDPAVLKHDTDRRTALLRIASSALDAVDPAAAVSRFGIPFDAGRFDRAVVLGIGKAAVAMGTAAVASLAGIETSGLLVTNAAAEAGPLEVVVGGHPVPDERSVWAGKRLLEIAHAARNRDLAVVLISGGGSALAEVPVAGVDLADLQEVTRLLLRSGATIDELNTVRKHLSLVKGGRLAEALGGAGAVTTLILSDVVGNPLDVIASGPTVPDPTTFADALAVLSNHDLSARVPAAILDHLEAGARGVIADTPSAGAFFDRQTVTIVADAGTAAHAAVAAAAQEGWKARVATSELQGEAREVARRLVHEAATLETGEMLVYAGETTVTVTGDGTGGRNQELALAASITLDGTEDLIVLSIGTDGIDGFGGAAGAFADGGAVARGLALGLDARRHLERNDSNPYLAAIGDLVVCGPTGTNVGDLVLVQRS